MVEKSAKLNISDLRAWYGQNEVIHGISFDIPKNEIFGIIGRLAGALYVAVYVAYVYLVVAHG